jgi:beta-N-acetylhexosaminidase
MLMVGFNGTVLHDSDLIIRDIALYGIGGTVLFDRNVALNQYSHANTSSQQVKELTNQLRSYAAVPLFIAVDQEGGSIVRLKESYGFPATVSAQHLGSVNDTSLTRRYAESIAGTLADNGLNMNFAPVVDLNVNPASPAIGAYGRSYSADPGVVIPHSRLFVEAHDKRQIATCLKHFPGHGSATGDSHVGFVDVTTTWSDSELEPYRVLIAEGNCRMVMTAHIFNRTLDPDYPATLSYPTITGILRKMLGYNGVVVTDDMQMEAVVQQYSFETAVEKALLAGVDMLMFANNLACDPDLVPKTIEIITRLVQSEVVPQERINESYDRIMAMKRHLL